MARFVIVGMGAAGFGAAETIRQHQRRSAITVITEESDGYYSRPGLAYLLTSELPERRLSPRSPKDLDQLGLEQIVARVARVEPQARRVVLDDGRVASYDALLLAPGAAAIPPAFPGADLPGVVTLDNMDDVRQILRLSRRARSAVVIGGGITALELVEGLRAQKMRVHFFLRRDRFWSSVLDSTESELVAGRLADEGVQIHRRTEISRVLGKRGWRGRLRVAGVETQDGRNVPCGMVAVAVGVRPRLELVAGTGIRTDRGILVDQHLESNVPRVYAAGDVAQVLDPLTGKYQLDSLWPMAVAQGRVAGANMAGVPTCYRKGVPVNVTRLTGLVVALVGAVGQRGEPDQDLITISRGDSEAWRALPGVFAVHDYHEINRQRLMINGNRLVGALLMGDQSLLPLVRHLIEKQVDLTPILPALRAREASIADLVQRVVRRPVWA